MKIPFRSGKCKVTSPYGERTLSGKTQFHSGYDLVPVGAWDVCAVEGSTVVSSRIVTDRAFQSLVGVFIFRNRKNPELLTQDFFFHISECHKKTFKKEYFY